MLKQWEALYDRCKMTTFGKPILELHKPHNGCCEGCEQLQLYAVEAVCVYWPCPTVQVMLDAIPMTLEELCA